MSRCDIIEVEIEAANGNDTNACCLGDTQKPCKTLDFALSTCRKDSVSFVLVDTQYFLSESIPPFTNLDNLSINTASAFKSIVSCTKVGVGLAFVNVSYITIANIVFQNCSALRNSTSRNYSDTDNPNALSKFYVGLYFYSCNTVWIDSIAVQNSPNATGVVMYDTIGDVTISNSNFSGNSVLVPSKSLQGGGGFYVEFSYCAPGETCNDTQIHRSNTKANYSFKGCYFVNNIASLMTPITLFIPDKIDHVAFGRGGGLSFHFSGDATGNVIYISHCNFISNNAVYGGGLFVEFRDTATGNKVKVEFSIFENNSVLSQFETNGGGAQIIHFVLANGVNDTGNNITFVSCKFHSNTGYYGGGVSIEPALQNTNKEVASIAFMKCTFDSNIAYLGPAIYVALNSLITSGLVPIVNFNAVNVSNNIILSKNYTGYGSVYVNGIPVNFKDTSMFDNNTGSSLAVVGAYLNFSSCEANFVGNIGQKGGAIALLGAAWILIDSNTNMSFVNNKALSFGGAIYNLYIQLEKFETSTNCFFKYADATIAANKWTAHFLFHNNSDGFGNNSIHSTSILPCGAYLNDFSQIFCWNAYWDYSGMDCRDEISSDAARVTFPQHVSIYPGEVLKLPLNVTDNLEHDIINQTTFLGTFNNPNISLHVSANLMYITNGHITMSGSGTGNTILSMEGVENVQLQVNMPIEIIDCPPALINLNSTCMCDITGNYGNTVLCLGPQTATKMPTALLQIGYWMGTIPGKTDDILVGSCPSGYCDGASNNPYVLGKFITLPRSRDKLNDFLCSGNRTGVLCGRCKPTYAPVINSDKYPCVQCNSSSAANILKYIGTEYVPLTVFFLVIIICNVRLTTGPANAFIVFGQVISSTFDLNNGITTNPTTSDTFNTAYKLIYGIFNLDFFSKLLEPFCIGEKLDTLLIVSLSYIVALYPLLMICIVIIAFKLKSIVGCSKSKWCRQHSISPMMAITCFLLLSYNKLILTAVFIVSEGMLINSSGANVDISVVYIQGDVLYDEREKYVSVAAVVLFITLILPIVLLGYPITFLERCLKFWPMINKRYPADKVNIFLDCFQGSFENNKRFFASLYFMFRLGIAIAYILPITELNELIIQQMICMIMSLLVVVLQPYKERLTNVWDCFVFLDLAVLSGLSLYASESEPSKVMIGIQSTLVMLPFLCMIVYWVWNVVPLSAKNQIKTFCTNINICNKGTRPHIPADDEEDCLIDRSQEINSYTGYFKND